MDIGNSLYPLPSLSLDKSRRSQMTEVSKRNYKKQLEIRRGNISKEQIASDKNARCHARNEARNTELREAAEDRFTAWNSLTVAGRIAALDARLGKGIGATKQRARLEAAAKAEVEAKKAKAKK